MATSSSNGGVPPGFRFHPTDEELLHYYLKKKIAYQKFDMEVIREVDLNKMEPWELQERCKIGSTPQNEWYFFSHKDRKYPTGSRTNRATNAGFWKATGRDKCIRNTYKKIGMRKTLVFYRGRAPHGQKTDWIMHEYRLEDGDDPEASEDGWVVCRVFKKKNLFKVTTNEGGTSSSMNSSDQNLNTSTTIQPRSYTQYHNLLRHGHQAATTTTTTNLELNKPTDLALHPYSHHIPTPQYSLFQSQPLLPSPHYSSIPSESSVMVKQLMTNPRDCESGSESLRQYQCGLGMEASTTVVDTTTSHQMVSRARTDDDGMSEWAMLTSHQDANAAPVSHQMNQQLSLRGEMDFWGYGGK